MKIKLSVFLFFVSFLLIFSCGCKNNPSTIQITEIPSAEMLTGSGQQGAGERNAYQLAEGLSIVEFFSYNGPFVEDGSNEVCEDIAAVRIENTSGINYSYIKFELRSSSHTYSFSAATVLTGTKMKTKRRFRMNRFFPIP